MFVASIINWTRQKEFVVISHFFSQLGLFRHFFSIFYKLIVKISQKLILMHHFITTSHSQRAAEWCCSQVTRIANLKALDCPKLTMSSTRGAMELRWGDDMYKLRKRILRASLSLAPSARGTTVPPCLQLHCNKDIHKANCVEPDQRIQTFFFWIVRDLEIDPKVWSKLYLFYFRIFWYFRS